MTGKTWGPFTGAQLTIMFVAAMAVALPGTLWAVAASAVSITDIANGHTAAVSSTRRLFVSALNEGAPTPASLFHPAGAAVTAGTGCLPVASVPDGKAAMITEVRLNAGDNPTPGPTSYVFLSSDAICSNLLAL